MSTKQPHPNQKSQTTLFQNWGYYGNHAKKVEGREEEPIVIEDDLEGVDEATLLAACEEAEGELTNQNTAKNPQPIPEATPLESLPGFDESAGKLWIYPTNYPVRDYQFNIVGQALKKNTLVTLPTGLGKTFIAAVVMYNYYRWYPQGKVVFMAPTKPLVAQQIEACFNIMGIPEGDMVEMTGSMPPSERKKIWKAKRVFFLTPQVLTNDLSRQACPAVEVKCLVVDEAHKALGNHAYCEVVRELSKYTPNFRVLALSATPGGDLKAVQQVINNLLISHIEIRSEDSIDIQPYAHERKVEKVVVPLGEELRHLQKQYLEMLRVYINRLSAAGAIFNKDPALLSKFQLLKAREAFRQDPPPQTQNKGAVEGDFAISMSLYHGYELLMQHGTRTLYNFLSSTIDGEKGFSRTRQELMRNGEFINIMNILREKFEYGENGGNMSLMGTPSSVSPSRSFSCTQKSKKFVVSHPKMQKLQEVVIQHFKNYQNNFRAKPSTSETVEAPARDTRVMIFAQYRDSVQEIAEMLNCHQPLVRCMSFVGQSSAGKATKGISQKEQLRVVKEFKCGNYNTLVSTCVGEEGLDIGDVDLIVCYDAHKSPTRLVQRMGRTGRKRSGRIVMLMTEGKEASVYDKSQYSRRGIHKALQGNSKSLQLFPGCPRMIHRGLEPQPHKMYITSEQYVGKQKKRKGEKKAPSGPITSSLKNDKKVTKAENAFLTDAEYRDWRANFRVEDAPVPTLPKRGTFLSLGGTKEVPKSPKLSLSSWSLWQAKEQKAHLVSHSKRSRDFVQLMEFMEIQDQIDGDDIYGMEMALHLKEEDVIKLRSSEGIEKYCKKKKGNERKEKGKNIDDKSGGGQSATEEEQVVKKRRKKKREPLPLLISDDSGDDFLDKSGGTLPEITLHDDEDKGEISDSINMPTVLGECHDPAGGSERRVNEGGKKALPGAGSVPLENGAEPSGRGVDSPENEMIEDVMSGSNTDVHGLYHEPGTTEDTHRLLGGKCGKKAISSKDVDASNMSTKEPVTSAKFIRPEAPEVVKGPLRIERSTGTDQSTDEQDTISELQKSASSSGPSENEDVPVMRTEKSNKLKKKRRKVHVDDDAFEEDLTEKTSTSPILGKSSVLLGSKKPPESPSSKKPFEVVGKTDKSPKHINDLLKLLKSHRKDTKKKEGDMGGDGRPADKLPVLNDLENVNSTNAGRECDSRASLIGTDGANVEPIDDVEEDLSCLFPCSQFSFSHRPTIRGNFVEGQLPPSPPSVSSLDILDDIDLSFGTPGRKMMHSFPSVHTPEKKIVDVQRRSPTVSSSTKDDTVSDSLNMRKTLCGGDTEQIVEKNESALFGSVKNLAGECPVPSLQHNSTEVVGEAGNTSCHKNPFQEPSGVRTMHHEEYFLSDRIPACVETETSKGNCQQSCVGELAGGSNGKITVGSVDDSRTSHLVESEGRISDSLCISDLQGFDDWDDTNDVPDIADARTPVSPKAKTPTTRRKLSVSRSCVGQTPTSVNRNLLTNGHKLSVSTSFVKVGEASDCSSSQLDCNLENKNDRQENRSQPDKSRKYLPEGYNFVFSDMRNAGCKQSNIDVNFDLNFDLNTFDDVTDGEDSGGYLVQGRMCDMTNTSFFVGASPHAESSYLGRIESFAPDESLQPPKAESTPLAAKTTFRMPTELALTPVTTTKPNSRKENDIFKIPLDSTSDSGNSAKLAQRRHQKEAEENGGLYLPGSEEVASHSMGSNSATTSARGSFLKKLSFCNMTKVSPSLESKKRKSVPSSPESVSKKRKSHQMDSASSPVKKKEEKCLDYNADRKESRQTSDSLPKSGDTGKKPDLCVLPVDGFMKGNGIEKICGNTMAQKSGQDLEYSTESGFGDRTSQLVKFPANTTGKADEESFTCGELQGKNGISRMNGCSPPSKHKRTLKTLTSPVNSSTERDEVVSGDNEMDTNVSPGKELKGRRVSAYDSAALGSKDAGGELVSPFSDREEIKQGSLNSPSRHRRKRKSKPILSPVPSSDEAEEVVSAPDDGGIVRTRQDSLHSPEPDPTKRGTRPLDCTLPEDDVIWVDGDDNGQANGSTQEFDICQTGNGQTSPVVVISEDEVLSQIPRAKKRCRNVLRSPDDFSPRSAEKVLKTRKVKKKVLQSSSDEDEATPVRRPPSRKRRLLISPPSLIPLVDSDFEGSTPQKPKHMAERVGFVEPPKNPQANKLNKKKSAINRFSEGAKAFLDEEAELSDEEGVSSDEVENSMLDHSLDGFINNATQLTQQSPAGAEDMHAVYMKSIRSPAGNAILHPGRNRFKMSHGVVNDNIFSQAPQPDESYANDSFCVEGDDRSRLGPADVSCENLENTINVENIIGGTGCKRLRNRRGGESRAERILRLGRKAVLKSDSTNESESGTDITAPKLEPPKRCSKLRGRRAPPKTNSDSNTNSSSDTGGKFAAVKGQQSRTSCQQISNGSHKRKGKTEGNGQIQGEVQEFHHQQIQPKGRPSEEQSHKSSSSSPRNDTDHPIVTECTQLKSRHSNLRGAEAQDGNEQPQIGSIGLNFDLGFGKDPFSDTEEEPVRNDPSSLFQNSVRESSALTKEQRERAERLRKQKEKQEEFRKRMAAKRKTMQGGCEDSQGFDVTDPKREGTSSGVASTKLNLPSRGLSPNLSHQTEKPVILIGSKELSSSPSMVSTLAIKHGMEPRVCQLRGCDFMVSTRMGVERRTLSDFAHSSNRTKLVERIKEMGGLFDKICIIVEKDRVKRDEKAKPFTRSKYFDSTLAALSRSSVKLLFSDSTDDTSILLADLAKVEARKGFSILYPEELTEDQEQVHSFCQSIPGVNFALSLSLMLKFPSLSEFIMCTENTLQLRTGVSQERARGIVGYLRHQFDEQMMGTPKRRR